MVCRHLAPHLDPCEAHRDDPLACPDVLFVRTRSGYGIPVRDGGSSRVEITHCPFCGAALERGRAEESWR